MRDARVARRSWTIRPGRRRCGTLASRGGVGQFGPVDDDAGRSRRAEELDKGGRLGQLAWPGSHLSGENKHTRAEYGGGQRQLLPYGGFCVIASFDANRHINAEREDIE